MSQQPPLSKKVLRQQKLLEKVANLGSSPINVLQAIAAKALNFKLKNSLQQQQRQQQQQQQQQQFIRESASLATTSAASRTDGATEQQQQQQLMNEIEMTMSLQAALLHENNNNNNLNISSNSSSGDDDEIFNQSMRRSVNSAAAASKFKRLKEEADAATDKTKRDEVGREKDNTNNDDEDKRKVTEKLDSLSEREHIQQHPSLPQTSVSATAIRSFSTDLISSTANQRRQQQQQQQELATTSAQQQQQQQQQANLSALPSNLFSVLKFWMSKRVDSINSNLSLSASKLSASGTGLLTSSKTTPNLTTATTTSALQTSAATGASGSASITGTDLRLVKLKAKNRLKTLKSIQRHHSRHSQSNQQSAVDRDDQEKMSIKSIASFTSMSSSSSSSSESALSLALSTSSETTFDSIIETNSINKIFEEKLRQLDELATVAAAVASTSSTTTTTTTTTSQTDPEAEVADNSKKGRMSPKKQKQHSTHRNDTAADAAASDTAAPRSILTSMDTDTTSNQNSSQSSSSNNNSNSMTSKFKKRLERIKKIARLVNEQNELTETFSESPKDKAASSSAAQRRLPPLASQQQSQKAIALSLSIDRQQEEEQHQALACRRNAARIAVPPTAPLPPRLVQHTLQLSQLQQLSLRNLGVGAISAHALNRMLRNLTSLQYLDISNCCTGQLYLPAPSSGGVDSASSAPEAAATSTTTAASSDGGIGLLPSLAHLAPTLTHLLLADLAVDDIQANVAYLLGLRALTHLDLSNCREKVTLNTYKNASLLLAKLVWHLCALRSLDISGTNLGGPEFFKEADEIAYIGKRLHEDCSATPADYRHASVEGETITTIQSGVCGLMFLNNARRRLDFLGCFCCDNAVSKRANLPADRIAGEESELHLYTSLQTYMHERPLFLLDGLNHLFELYRDELVQDRLLGGHLIMDTMERHLANARIQISGSASLFYVLKYFKEESVPLPHFYLQRLIRTVINGLEEHIDESPMRRNGVLIMCRLALPEDVLFVADVLIKILLKIFDDYIEQRNRTLVSDRPEHFVQRTAMHLLNILACSVHGTSKAAVGAMAIPVAMALIRTKTRFKEPDDILEVTWSFLWNITDETPDNCQIFLDRCDGMAAFLDCIQFSKSEIIRNMMGLLGNVAEVRHLRNRLCRDELIGTFRQLLFHTNDGIEIPYNSAGVLVHIMSDGPDAWPQAPTTESGGMLVHQRNAVIEDIETAIDKWDLKTERNINYRSFEPIFRLINEYENPICQRWSCWALANLTTVYPETYCPLFEKENGRLVLERVVREPDVNEAVKRYAQIVLDNVAAKTALSKSFAIDPNAAASSGAAGP